MHIVGLLIEPIDPIRVLYCMHLKTICMRENFWTHPDDGSIDTYKVFYGSNFWRIYTVDAPSPEPACYFSFLLKIDVAELATY